MFLSHIYDGLVCDFFLVAVSHEEETQTQQGFLAAVGDEQLLGGGACSNGAGCVRPMLLVLLRHLLEEEHQRLGSLRLEKKIQ